MISWQLWAALRRRRMRYARYERIVVPNRNNTKKPGLFTIITRSSVLLGIVGLVGIIFACTISWVLIVPLLCLIPFLLLGMGPMSGVIIANQVSGLIAKTQTQATYDTLSVLPRGTFALNWAITAYLFQQSRSLVSIRDMLSKAAIVMTFGTLGIAAMSVVFAASTYGFTVNLFEESLRIITGSIPFFVILAVIFIDLLQNTLIGSIIGMLMPTYITDRMSASLLSMGITLLLIIGYYVFIAIIFTLVLPPLYRLVGVRIGSDWYITHCLIFIGGRELIIYGLWKLLLHRINVEPPIIEELFGN